MIFLTVGTQFPFDRLVKAIDDLCGEGLISEEVFGQIGRSTCTPRHFPSVASLEKRVYDARFRQASAVISHAGMGVITMALDQGKPLLVMPRQKKYNEVVNDHQGPLAAEFETLGHILVARDETQLRRKVTQLRTFVPRLRQAQPEAVARKIRHFLERVQGTKPVP